MALGTWRTWSVFDRIVNVQVVQVLAVFICEGNTMHHVIVGTGPAGVVAAEHLRKLDADAEITMLGAEDKPPYSRMAIPYFLVGNIEEDGTYLRKAASHYQQHRINVVQNRVSSINTASKQLALGDGSSMGYDRLLVHHSRIKDPTVQLQKILIAPRLASLSASAFSTEAASACG